MTSGINIRQMNDNDIVEISNAFKQQGWNKSEEQYYQYYQEKSSGIRTVLVAELNDTFAGYVTILWNSDDSYFNTRCIPEIKDFNVLIKYRNLGIGSKLMDEAERIVFKKHDKVGLSVGLLRDYGSAQRMYVKRGYIPTGEGLRKSNSIIEYMESVVADDNLVLSFIKYK